MSTSSPDSKSSQHPVDPRTVNERLDELFSADRADRYERARDTLKAIFQRGLDQREGPAYERVLNHLASLIDQYIARLPIEKWRNHPDAVKLQRELDQALKEVRNKARSKKINS